jgi:uncharacterized protein GlcG (DUF336 family)
MEVKDVLAVAGGVPILFGKEVVGAVGVSGSPGVAHDERCADIGIRARRPRRADALRGWRLGHPWGYRSRRA